jgi:hypothetical protein
MTLPSFDSPGFISLLEWAKTFPSGEGSRASAEVEFAEGKLLDVDYGFSTLPD